MAALRASSAKRRTRSGWRSPARRIPAALRGDPLQVRDAALIDGQKRIEDGGHQDRAALMLLYGMRIVGRAGFGPFPVALRVEAANIAAQGPMKAVAQTELLGQLAKQIAVAQIAADAAYLVLKDARQRKMLEQSDDVGKGFVEGQHVEVGGFHQPAGHAVQEGMGRFMGHDVV